MGKTVSYVVQGPRDGEIVVEITSSLTGFWSAGELQEILEEGAAQGQPILSLNLGNCPAINSSSLGKLLILQKTFREQGIHFRIRGCSSQVYNTLMLVRADTILDISQTV